MVFAGLSGMDDADSGSSDRWLTPTEIELRNYLKYLPAEKAMVESGFPVKEYVALTPSQIKEAARVLGNYDMGIPQKDFPRILAAKSGSLYVGYFPVPNVVVWSHEFLSSDSKIPEAVRAYEFTASICALQDGDATVQYPQKTTSIRAEILACNEIGCRSCINNVATYFQASGKKSILSRPKNVKVIIDGHRLHGSLCTNCKEAAWKESQSKVRELR